MQVALQHTLCQAASSAVASTKPRRSTTCSPSAHVIPLCTVLTVIHMIFLFTTTHQIQL